MQFFIFNASLLNFSVYSINKIRVEFLAFQNFTLKFISLLAKALVNFFLAIFWTIFCTLFLWSLCSDFLVLSLIKSKPNFFYV